MKTIKLLTIILPAVVHIILAAWVIIKISKTAILSKKQKQLNIILTIAVPFIWSILVYYLLKNEPGLYQRKKVISNSQDDKLSVININNGGGFHH